MPRRSLRCLIPACDRHASDILLAVSTASRGGTMLSMMSVSATKASSEGREMISAALMRSRVCWLFGEFSMFGNIVRVVQQTFYLLLLCRPCNHAPSTTLQHPYPYLQLRGCQWHA